MPKKPHSPKLTPALEEELRDRLEDTLDEIDDVTDKRRRISRHLGGHLKVLAETRDLVRRQIKGVDLDQLEIPGTEKPEPAKDPIVSEILRIAGGIVDPKAKEAAGEPEPLIWRGKEEAGIVVANVIGGTYRLKRNEGPGDGWSAEWDGGSQGKLLLIAKPLADCKEACRKHHLERAGDEFLKNAGAGDLAKRELGGEPERFKKGGRRG